MAIIILQNITISFENWPKKVEKNSEYPDQKFPMTVKSAKVAKFRKSGHTVKKNHYIALAHQHLFCDL